MDFYFLGFNVPYIALMVVGTLTLLRLRAIAIKGRKHE